MPIMTISTPGPDFTESQLVLLSLPLFGLYAAFLFFQTESYRDHNLLKTEKEKD
jgi:Ca2+:H+ antiporter